MDVGSIYLHDKFKFEDGSEKKKFFVVVSPGLNDNENYLVCRTTSKEKPPYRIKKQGCDAKKNYFMLLQNDDWFEKNTWVQFDRIYVFKVQQLLKDRFDKQVTYKANLKPKNVRAILNCILRSRDVPQNQKTMIKNNLKELRKT